MDIAASFPILSKYTYLNTANSGILSEDLAKWRNDHDQKFVNGASAFRMENTPVIEKLRANVSVFFGSLVENTFLVPNFSFGFNTILDGLAKNHRFLLLNEEYPSVEYPVISRGFEHFQLDINEHLEENIVSAIKKHKITVFAFSVVQYISGYRLNPEFIKRLKNLFPALILIGDGTQFCGTASFNFENSGMDALVSSGYKWLLGGFGNGFVLLSNQLKNELYEERKTIKLPFAPMLQGKSRLAFCFEPGHLDTLNFGSLNQGLNLIKKVGIKEIEKTTQALCNKARIELHQRGLIPSFLAEQEYPSTIMSMPLNQPMVVKLEEAKILCSPRGMGTRISFHFYNLEEDLQKLLTVLDGKNI